MSAASGAVAVLAVLSVHGVPMLIRCVGSAPPPRREVVGILNAVFQSVRQQALGAAGEGAGGDAAEPALLLQQLRSSDARVTFRAYAPADVLLVLMQNGGAAQGVGDGGGGTSLLDMCYQTILLLGGEKGGMLAAKDNPQSFQRKLRSIAYYLDTIIGGDGLLYQPSEAAASPGGARGSAPGARDRAARAAAASVSTALRAPSCALVPYKAAFELRRILTNWVNAYGASAAALIVGPCGSMVSSADPHIAAATDKWYEDTNPSQLAALQLLWAHHVSSGKDDVRVSNVWLDSFLRHDDQSESAKFTAFYAFPLVETVELLVLAHPRWPADATKRFAAPPETVRSALLQEVPLGYLRACAGSLPAGIPRSVELDAGLLGFIVLLPCHGGHRFVDEFEEASVLYGKRALVCVDPSALAKHGDGPVALEGDDAGSGASADLPAAARRSLLLAFYSHASPLLPRMCRAEGEVGAMEGKGGPGPRTSEVYMCSEECSLVAVARTPATVFALLSPEVPRYALVPLAEELIGGLLHASGRPAG